MSKRCRSSAAGNHRRDGRDKARRAVARTKTRTRGQQFRLTIQAHAGLPCPSDRALNPVRPQRTRNLMEDWKPWLDITLQKRRDAEKGNTKESRFYVFGRFVIEVARLGSFGGTGLLLGEKLQS